MVNSLQNGKRSFIFTILLVHTTTSAISTKNLILYFSQLSPLYSRLFNKIILTIPTNTLYLYTSALFHLPIFTYKHPSNQHQKYFPYFSYLVCSDSVKGPRSYGVLSGITLFQSLPSSSKYGQ